MTFHHFGDSFQRLHGFIEILGMLQVQPHIGTRLVTYLFGVDDELRTFYHSEVSKFLNSLVDSGAADVARSCYFQERDSCVFGYQLQDLLV